VIKGVTRRSISRGSEAEKAFINDLKTGVPAITVGTLNTPADIDRVAQALADVFSTAWDKHSKEVCITKHSQPWWDDECTASLSQYKTEKSEESWLAFRQTIKAAKRKFFDSRIEDIALSNKCPWDLMEWSSSANFLPVRLSNIMDSLVMRWTISGTPFIIPTTWLLAEK